MLQSRSPPLAPNTLHKNEFRYRSLGLSNVFEALHVVAVAVLLHAVGVADVVERRVRAGAAQAQQHGDHQCCRDTDVFYVIVHNFSYTVGMHFSVIGVSCRSLREMSDFLHEVGDTFPNY